MNYTQRALEEASERLYAFYQAVRLKGLNLGCAYQNLEHASCSHDMGLLCEGMLSIYREQGHDAAAISCRYLLKR